MAVRVVAGVDVGGAKKGFHGVILREGKCADVYSSNDAKKVARWIADKGALVVEVDAPCGWSASGKSRLAERELAAEGISAFSTPGQSVVYEKDFYRWMRNGALLYQELNEAGFSLYSGVALKFGERSCFETFPQAVACALAKTKVSAKQKATIRRKLLVEEARIEISKLKNIDLVDAALCAVAAAHLAQKRVKSYGDKAEGFILVPA